MDGMNFLTHRSRAIAALVVALAAAPAHAQTEAPTGTTPPPAATAPPAKPQHLGDRLPLRQGMRGKDVTELQKLLTRAGYATAADGDFGPGTATTLGQWETIAKRRSDGVLNSADLSALRTAAAQGPPPSEPPPPAPAIATITAAGKAVAPAGAPDAVVAMIAAGNRIAKKPYIYGGGHQSFTDKGYDCSASVSYVLHGAGLLDYPLDSTGLESFGEPSYGQWVTIYANAGHAFMVIAGIRFDTSGQRQAGTRWQPLTTRSYDGFYVRHPTDL